MFVFTQIFLLLLLVATSLQLWLGLRQIRHVRQHRAAVPGPFAGQVSLEEHQKAADYTIARTRMGMLELIYGAVLLLGWTLGGGLELLDGLWRSLGLWSEEWRHLWTGTGFMLSFFMIGSLLDLPFSLYRTFRLEARFGFNNTTARLFIADLIKGVLLTLLIGTPLLVLVLWLMQVMGDEWWLYVWAVWIGFTLLMLWAYPSFIAPLFNKFQPLEDGELRGRIERLLERCGFASDGIFVMDGSRRSSHGNAYFSGLGKHKRIVFFDTLLESLNGDEIEAVLAHELGHFRRRHIAKRLLMMAIISFGALALLGWLWGWFGFYLNLGVSHGSNYMALTLFILCAPLLGVYLQPLMALSSRRHEFEADDYAAEQSSAAHLISALVKLYRENASSLTPDPLHSAFHDSHPPAPVRIAHLSAKMTDA